MVTWLPFVSGFHEKALQYELDIAQARAQARVLGIDIEPHLLRAHQASVETPYPWDFIWRHVWGEAVREATSQPSPRMPRL